MPAGDVVAPVLDAKASAASCTDQPGAQGGSTPHPADLLMTRLMEYLQAVVPLGVAPAAQPSAAQQVVGAHMPLAREGDLLPTTAY